MYKTLQIMGISLADFLSGVSEMDPRPNLQLMTFFRPLWAGSQSRAGFSMERGSGCALLYSCPRCDWRGVEMGNDEGCNFFVRKVGLDRNP